MPDSGIQPPYLDPSAYPDYLDVQRKQMIAQMLLGSMQNSGQTPANWDQMKVVPRRGLAMNVAPLVSALMAGKAMKGAQTAEQQYFQNLYGGAQSGQPSGAQPPQDGAPQGAPTAGAQPPTQPAQSAQGPGNPMLLTGQPGTSQMLLGMMGPQEYGKSLAARYAPLEIDRQLTAAGITDPLLRRQIIQQRISKENYIPPVGVRGGETMLDSTTQQPFFTGPQGPIQTQWGPQGATQSVIPGGVPAAAAVRGAEKGAEVANTPTVIPTRGGGSTYGYPQDVIGTPPALRTPGSPAVAPRTTPSGPQTPSGTQPSANARDPWSSVPKLQIPQGIGAPDAFTEGTLKAAGERHATLSAQVENEAALAEQQLEYNREARNALPGAEVGPMSEWLTRNRSALLQLGVPASLVPDSGTVVPTLELNKALKNAALQGARQIYGPRMTQTEVKLQTEEMSPSSGMMRDAIDSLMKQNDARSLYTKQRALDYGRYMQGGGDPLRFESWYASKFPLTRFAAAAQATPQELAAEAKRRGLQ